MKIGDNIFIVNPNILFGQQVEHSATITKGKIVEINNHNVGVEITLTPNGSKKNTYIYLDLDKVILNVSEAVEKALLLVNKDIKEKVEFEPKQRNEEVYKEEVEAVTTFDKNFENEIN